MRYRAHVNWLDLFLSVFADIFVSRLRSSPTFLPSPFFSRHSSRLSSIRLFIVPFDRCIKSLPLRPVIVKMRIIEDFRVGKNKKTRNENFLFAFMSESRKI